MKLKTAFILVLLVGLISVSRCDDEDIQEAPESQDSPDSFEPETKTETVQRVDKLYQYN